MLFPKNLVPALWSCQNLVFNGFYAHDIFALYFPFLN